MKNSTSMNCASRALPSIRSAAAVLALGAATASAATYTWMSSPANGNWDTTSANWNTSAAWVNNNDAAFPASSSQFRPNVSEAITVGNLTINNSSTQYEIKGTGPLTVTGTLALSGGNKDLYVYVPLAGSALHVQAGNSTTVRLMSSSNAHGATYLEGANPFILYLSGDGALGEAPASPENNIFVSGSGLKTIRGGFDINANRTVVLNSGATLEARSTGSPLAFKGVVKAETADSTTTRLIVNHTSSTPGAVVLDPGAGRTNAFGRLMVKQIVKAASGVTRLSGSGGTGESANLYICGLNTGYTSYRGILNVDGGELYSTQGSIYVDAKDYAQVTVTNGGKIVMPNAVYMNGNGTPAKLTVVNGGVVHVKDLMISDSTSTSEVWLEEGGLIKAERLYMDHTGRPCDFHFNGGTYQATKEVTTPPYNMAAKGDSADYWTGVRFLVGEKGAVFDTSIKNTRLGRPLESGAANDGGLRKVGSGNLYLLAANTYNGTTRVEGGELHPMVDDAIPAGSTLSLANSSIVHFRNANPSSVGRIEGDGDTWSESGLSVTNSIAPSIGGTIRFRSASDLAAKLEILGDATRCGRIRVVGTQDISGLKPTLAAGQTLDKNAPRNRYQILYAPDGYTGTFDESLLTGGWTVKYETNGAYLYWIQPTVLSMR